MLLKKAAASFFLLRREQIHKHYKINLNAMLAKHISLLSCKSSPFFQHAGSKQPGQHTHSKEEALISHSVPEHIIIGSLWCVWCDATKIPDIGSLINSLNWKNWVCCKGQSLTQAKTTNYKTGRAEWGLNTPLPTDGLMALWRFEFAIMPGRPIFTKSTLINISGLPARLNLSSAVICPVWTDQP